MLKTLRLIASDLKKKASWCYQDESPKGIAKALATDGTASMIVYRLMQASRRHNLAPLEMAFNKVNSAMLGCVIGRGTEFDEGFVLIHSNGVVINGAVRGGRNVLIEHQVTIGAEGRQSPVIGDDVFVGAGAKIVGPVQIGDGARVGANAVVVKDVAANTTVVGIPAKPVERRSGSGGEAGGDADAGAGRNGKRAGGAG